jgi:hypothetical protein
LKRNYLGGGGGYVYVKHGDIYIDDYIYTPKYRDSLKDSRIGEILEEWYLKNHDKTITLVQKFCSYKNFYQKIPLHSKAASSPQWINGWIPPFDAMSVYSFLAIKNPRYYVEVGSGNTTMFAAQSIRDNNLRTKIISIDPHPRVGIDVLCDKIYRIPFENMELDFFSSLSADDIFLLDNSHRSFPNSDVTVFFTEVLPRLPSGILYTMHDIFLPRDYPEQWTVNDRSWYNEQYLLCMYLLGGANGDEIISPNAFLGTKNDILKSCNTLWGDGELFEKVGFGGGFFWLRKS